MKFKGDEEMTFITSCVNANGSDIADMVDCSTEIRYKTFRSRVGKAFAEVESELGYTHRFRMKDDYHVRFNKSTYKGRQCYFFVHSAIEYVFQ